jgi:hypothetical protein
MSLEALAGLAQVGTFVVIAATAVAALIQLSHLRAANQFAADWVALHPQGDYPKDVRRMPLTDPWRDLDQKNRGTGVEESAS